VALGLGPASVTNIVSPRHIVDELVIATAPAFTVSTCVTKHPFASRYEMVVVPVLRPHKIPVVEPIVPTAALLLLHVPPATEFDNVVQAPTHADVPPVIAVGIGQNCTVHVFDVQLVPPIVRQGVIIEVTCTR
jgi:hypothetical protein